MTESVRRHLPIIVVVSLVGIATSYFLLARVYADASHLDVGAFGTYIFLIPCAVMFVCSTIIMLTAHEIGRQLYLVVVGICLAAGIVCMVITSVWLMDDSIAAALLANSADDATVVPIINSPVLVLRDIAAFFVAPTVGSIVGAWLGSRMHPMEHDAKDGRRKAKKKR